MDYYLKTDNTYNRLLKEYQKYQGLTIAFDFDNTVYDFHNKGLTFDAVTELLRGLKSIGCYLIVFTANENLQFVAKYCQENNIPFDAINENPHFYKSTSRKIYYNALLDDRAGLAETYQHLNTLLQYYSNGN